ncbi:MAG: LLM class flavin-dependent oxidoreductase [Anaerolineae bacterium]|nr:LLM class flavin-dependent oxidoreductase [Anaerolineae bacterium]
MGVCSDPHVLIDLAQAAEACGWDGFLVWDCVYVKTGDPRNTPACDPWIALAAIAARTQKIKLGTIITPLSRRRPWKVARETVSLDHLSRGRMILPVGLGALNDGGFCCVGEEMDRIARAERLDESLEIIEGLWSGAPYSFHGKHYHIDEMQFLPAPVQTPRIPIWVVGAWPRFKSMSRAIRYDGLLAAVKYKGGEDQPPTAENIREMQEFVVKHRGTLEGFNIVTEGPTPGDDPEAAAAIVRPFGEAGATWWLESVWTRFYEMPGEVHGMLERIRQGPPPYR